MIDQLLINDNAYFYNKVKSLSANKINQIFTEISREKLSNRYSLKEIKSVATVGNENFYYSICIFKYNHKPSFLREPAPEWFEVKFSFLLIVEYSDYIVIYKNNVAGLRSLKEHVEHLDYSVISRLFLKDDTLYEKFYVSNMSTADNALRNKSMESNNLQGTISRLGAPKQVIHNMRISDGQNRTSLSLNTSRINNLGDKKVLQDFFTWTVDVAREINAFNRRDTYLDNFAQPISFEDYVVDLVPICILLKFDKLLDELERENIQRVYQEDEDGNEIEDFDLHIFIDHFKSTLNIVLDNDGSYLIENPIDEEMRLNIAKKSMRINSSVFKNVKIDRGGDVDTDLNTFINSRNDFIVNFTEPDLIYTYRKLFRDHRLLADISGFLTVFHPYNGLTTTNSEKGNFVNAQTEFDSDSVFRFVQDELNKDSIALFCDDLGNEWADFIAVKHDSIVLYHAKHKDGQGLSASALQDVIGQAHKNLGNLEPTDAMIDRKAEITWGHTYIAPNGANTAIQRLIIGPNNSLNDSITAYKNALSQPNVKRQVNLVVDFISKTELQNGLQLLGNNQVFARRNEVTQILWFVSSLVANCRELGIEVYISCRP